MSATIHDVAKHAGVAVGTVSRYLNGHTLREHNHRKVEDAIAALKFKENIMARGLKRNRSMTVAVVAPDFSSFVAAITPVIEHKLEEYRYSLITCSYHSSHEQLRRKVAFLRDHSVDGIVLFPSNLADASLDILQHWVRKPNPLILIDHLLDTLRTDAIIVDNLNTSFRAIERLILGNHKAIAFIDGPDDSLVSRQRLEGYCAAMNTYNLPIHEDWVQRGTFTQSGGYQAIKTLWHPPDQPSAVYVANYEMTIGAILALHELHVRIPEDVSFIGFDHFEAIDVVEPPLTVVERPIVRIGQLAAQLMLQRIQGDYDDFPTVVKVHTKMNIRNSVRHI